MARLTQKQIIENLQYIAADYAGQVQRLAEKNRDLLSYLSEAEAAAHRPPVDNSKKLTPADVRRMRAEYRTTSLNQKALADIYEVNPATVSRIVRGVYHARVR